MGVCSSKSATKAQEPSASKAPEPQQPSDTKPEEDPATLLKSLFSKIDTDADGKLDAKELAKALSAESDLEKLLEKAGYNSKFYVLEQLDSNQDGRVSWDEFKESLTVKKEEMIGVSRFNDQYYCTIHKYKWTADGEITLYFTVVGDESLGALQDPSSAKVSWDDGNSTPASHDYTHEDPRKMISGSLVYRGVPKDKNLYFAFGFSGYSSVKIEAEAGAGAESTSDKEATLNTLKSLFAKIDADDNGNLDAKELAKALKAEPSLETLLEKAGFNSHFYVLEQLDSNQDGKVSWDEFRASLEAAAGAEQQAKSDKGAESGEQSPQAPPEAGPKVENTVAPKGGCLCL